MYGAGVGNSGRGVLDIVGCEGEGSAGIKMGMRQHQAGECGN